MRLIYCFGTFETELGCLKYLIEFYVNVKLKNIKIFMNETIYVQGLKTFGFQMKALKS